MISVITPVYNGEKFIESCIKVVIEQNCPDAEHIIVDGGSTDGTVNIIKQYAEQYPHISWVSEPDKGQSDAMNKGLALAKGEIIGFLNVDDFYEPNVLKRVLQIFKTLPEPSLLLGNCNFHNEQEKVWVHRPANPELAEWLKIWNSCPWPINPSAYFYHKSLHQKIGIYNLNDHYAMDFDFLLRAVQIANCKYVNETWGNYRFIKGTKSFETGESGEYKNIQARMYKLYSKNLPIKERLKLLVGYYIHCKYPKTGYFWRKLKVKFQKICKIKIKK